MLLYSNAILFSIGVFFVLASIFFGNLTHFTWWNILIFCIWCLLGEHRKDIELTSLLLNFTVVLVVVVMSFSECEMINDAYRDLGPGMYGVGNFLVHYFPSLILVWFGEHKLEKEHMQRQGILAAGLLSFYLTHDDFTVVYGCSIPEQAAELFTLFVLLLAWLPDELGYFLIYPEPLESYFHSDTFI